MAAATSENKYKNDLKMPLADHFQKKKKKIMARSINFSFSFKA